MCTCHSIIHHIYPLPPLDGDSSYGACRCRCITSSFCTIIASFLSSSSFVHHIIITRLSYNSSCDILVVLFSHLSSSYHFTLIIFITFELYLFSFHRGSPTEPLMVPSRHRDSIAGV